MIHPALGGAGKSFVQGHLVGAGKLALNIGFPYFSNTQTGRRLNSIVLLNKEAQNV